MNIYINLFISRPYILEAPQTSTKPQPVPRVAIIRTSKSRMKKRENPGPIKALSHAPIFIVVIKLFTK